MKKFIALFSAILLVVIILPTGNSNVFADFDDYVDWTWGTATNDLSVQDFCSTYQSQVSSHYDDWNGIDSDVFFFLMIGVLTCKIYIEILGFMIMS